MNKRIMNFETNNVLVAPFCISEWKNTQNKKKPKKLSQNFAVFEKLSPGEIFDKNN